MIALIGVPSSAGARRSGQEDGPAALRVAGLVERLRESGLDVVDLGDLPRVAFRSDEDRPRCQNLPLVIEVARRVADRVEQAAADGRFPLVLGGDCSLSLGVVAGLLRHHEGLGLVYFDGDVDLNTPETTPSGALDGMVLAHLLGRGVPELAAIGPRSPMLSEDEIVLFGYDVGTGWIDPPELEALDESRMATLPVEVVRADPTGAASAAVTRLSGRSPGFLVHFDIDVTNLPAVDVLHPRGLEPEAAFAALERLVATPRCAGLVVTELNAERDPEGVHAVSIVDGLVAALGRRRGRGR